MVKRNLIGDITTGLITYNIGSRVFRGLKPKPKQIPTERKPEEKPNTGFTAEQKLNLVRAKYGKPQRSGFSDQQMINLARTAARTQYRPRSQTTASLKTIVRNSVIARRKKNVWSKHYLQK